jgi:hypothetical protein
MVDAAAQYHVTTRWSVRAPVGAVWTELTRPEAWPDWWKGVLAVDLLEAGDSNGLGAYRRMTCRAALPGRISFNMRTVRLEPRTVIEVMADGELSGPSRWQLTRTGNGTDVRYDWIVTVTKQRAPALALFAKPLFEWNHGVIMNWGRKGLERRVGRR